ncbi:MAG: hypothetical protein OXD45_02845 [Rhodobacteraceae bacterium]|nr:hypothetical protein [Paracoccaceae bacterium]
MISRISFAIFAVIIRKRELENECKEMFYPYHLAMIRGMNLLSEFLLDKNQNNTVNHIVCESRGKTEDKILEVEFGHILQDSSFLGSSLKYELVIANKRVNSTELQIADLTARPIAYKNLHPDRDNRPYEIIQDKIKKTDVPPPHEHNKRALFSQDPLMIGEFPIQIQYRVFSIKWQIIFGTWYPFSVNSRKLIEHG